ncbi:hypothetical protein EVAR_87185_1 [Eumeta japonica]|uniref:Uncharacterized protein n=1 Tax=Eumeta variegata TaxID=151549 RepID=A0A4C1VXI3_EUMVA|nr:hypothetical protein EVAR_87185_1 [Eumeta japonica]
MWKSGKCQKFEKAIDDPPDPQFLRHRLERVAQLYLFADFEIFPVARSRKIGKSIKLLGEVVLVPEVTARREYTGRCALSTANKRHFGLPCANK